MMLDENITVETRLKLIELLRVERNWHIDTILKTNGYLTVGGAAVVLSGVLGAHELRGLLPHLNKWAAASATIIVLGAALVAAALIRHWSFRSNQSRECSELMAALLSPAPVSAERVRERQRELFKGLPPDRWFGWALGVGVGAMIAGGAGMLVCISAVPAPGSDVIGLPN